MSEKKKSNFLKRVGIGALMIATLLSPITACASQQKANPFKNYPTKVEVMQDAKVDYVVNLRDANGGVVRLDKKFNYGIKVLNERTSIAMKDVTDNIPGLELGWDQANQIAEAKGMGKELLYPINKRVMSANGKITELDTSASVDAKVSRTYLPLRSLMESLGYDVEYTHDTKTIDIYEKGATKVPSTPVVVKPVEKSDADRGPKAKYEIEVNNFGGIDYSLQKFEPTDFTKMPLIDKKGEENFPKERRFNETINAVKMLDMIAYYPMYDGTDYFRDLEFNGFGYDLYEEGTQGGVIERLSLLGSQLMSPNSDKQYRMDAAEDMEGNIYFGMADRLVTTTTEKPLLGNTIKTVYLTQLGDDVIIKIDLANPITIKGELVQAKGSKGFVVRNLRKER